jgi:F-type H+-transporting ATPase subunit gamma
MPSLKSFKVRIASVKSTRKITKAMQLVAAAKLRRAQEAAVSARPFAEKMERVLANLGGSMKDNPGAPRLLAGTGSDKVQLLVVAAAERGLCGGFNTNIVRLAKQTAARLIAEGKKVKIFTVGKKARDGLKRDYGSYIVESVDFAGVKQIGFANAQAVATRVLEMFDEGQFDVATLFFSKFKSVIAQVPTAQRLIPADLGGGSGDGDGLKGSIYTYEPDETAILDDLLPRNVSVQIFKALLENAASEQGARMSAMDNATRNAGDVINKLTIVYNRTRQAMITKELIEIISGAEAL